MKCQPSSINQSSARNNNGRGDGAAFMGLTHGYRQQHLRVALTQEEKARLGVCRRISHAGRTQEAEKRERVGRGGSHLVDVLLQKEKRKKKRKTPLAKRKNSPPPHAPDPECRKVENKAVFHLSFTLHLSLLRCVLRACEIVMFRPL